MLPSTFLILLVGLLSLLQNVVGFLSLDPRRRSSATMPRSRTSTIISRFPATCVAPPSQLHYFSYPGDEFGSDPRRPIDMELQELERARAAFEALLERQQQKQQQDEKPEHIMLTNSGRRLRELEIELLKSLATSDGAIDELIHLWTTERDEEASIYILAMQSASECSAGLVEEEEALRRMSKQYLAWAEPYARLATL